MLRVTQGGPKKPYQIINKTYETVL